MLKVSLRKAKMTGLLTLVISLPSSGTALAFCYCNSNAQCGAGSYCAAPGSPCDIGSIWTGICKPKAGSGSVEPLDLPAAAPSGPTRDKAPPRQIRPRQ
jgi:hypothetical protein